MTLLALRTNTRTLVRAEGRLTRTVVEVLVLTSTIVAGKIAFDAHKIEVISQKK